MLTLTSPVETPWHRVRAAWKLLALCAFTVLVLVLSSPMALGLAVICVAALYLPGGWVFVRAGLRMLWPLWPFLVIVAAWHLWIGAAASGAVVALRLVAAVVAANLVTMTTRLSDMVTVVERLAAPLARLGLSPRMLALAIALVIRFVPVLSERAAVLGEAWRARSARRPSWRLVIPVTLAALDDAEHVAEALRARGGVE
jgi:biotin transport system permease protein